jgi:predicted GNAT family N-acyltransferase
LSSFRSFIGNLGLTSTSFQELSLSFCRESRGQRGFLVNLGHDNESVLATDRSLFSKLSTVKTAVRVRRIESGKQLEKAYSIRTRVFVKEQGVPEEIELDHDDKRAVHFLAFAAGKACGTARVVIRHGNAKIGRMAVLRSYRGKGIGTRLLKQAIRMAKQQNAKTIYLHAQVSVIGFYQTMNFRCVGPVFNEAGIPHRKMLLISR